MEVKYRRRLLERAKRIYSDDVAIINADNFSDKLNIALRQEGTVEEFINEFLWLLIFGLIGFIGGMLFVVSLIFDLLKSVRL